jgi:hypothetical protein
MNALTTMTWRTGKRESQWHNQLTDLGELRLFGSKGALGNAGDMHERGLCRSEGLQHDGDEECW